MLIKSISKMRFRALLRTFAICTTLWPTSFSNGDAPVQREEVFAIADRIRGWPEYYDADLLPDEDRTSLDAMLGLPAEALDILVASDNPRHRSLAVRLANCRGDLERLRSWKHLQKDEARGLPDAGYSNAPGEHTTEEGRRSHYIVCADQPPVEGTYRAAYAAWFGLPSPRVPLPSDPHCLDLDAVDFSVNVQTDLSKLVQPWVRRLELSRATQYSPRNIPGCLDLDQAVVLDQIRTLDPALRWGVIMRAEKMAVLESTEAQALLSELPQATVQSINAGQRLLIDDPAYAHPDSEAPLRAKFLELVEMDPTPSAPE